MIRLSLNTYFQTELTHMYIINGHPARGLSRNSDVVIARRVKLSEQRIGAYDIRRAQLTCVGGLIDGITLRTKGTYSTCMNR